MKYLLQIRFTGAAEKIARLPDEERRRVTSDFEQLRRQPGIETARRLHDTDTALTVQARDGHTTVVSGLPVPPLDSLDGYYVYDGDLDGATAVAARVPVLRFGGSVEIRPLRGD
ncbi:MAG TPA: hypothetical protein VJU80_09325 [Solirubrobacteraceae bacterium]|nr:hypothetical protein [Solirubrobacteraceae bacterium]